MLILFTLFSILNYGKCQYWQLCVFGENLIPKLAKLTLSVHYERLKQQLTLTM